MSKIIRELKLDVSQEKVYKRLMKKGFDKAVPRVKKIVSESLEDLYLMLEPAINYADLRINSKTDDAIVLEEQTFHSSFLSEHLEDSDKLTVYIATIGSTLEDKIEAQEENIRSLVLDSIGSEATEALAEKFSKLTQKRAGLDGAKEITSRFSPGYGDFNLRNQEKIFSLLSPQKVGVELTENFLMVPQKTTSGVIGWIY